ncbi:MAG: Ppx/GppA phosphatase family protein [Myxococcota bacterium]|nr:Ppx/GppA phosphatase family protein [Myxococcota bacterium]
MTQQTFASVDLGSNSFHLLVVREQDGELSVVDKVRERVRLAAGLNRKNVLRKSAVHRAIQSLAVFGERIADLHPSHVRVVGTNTLRKATNRDEFLARAREVLGHDVHVISGAEEARLIYLGVANDVQDDGAQRLVIDIGGGSTECIVGSGDLIVRTDSLYMGCVEYTRRFFSDGEFTQAAIDHCVTAARLELGEIHRTYKNHGWAHCYGSSGTINAIQTVLTANDRTDHCITLDGLKWLMKVMKRQRLMSKLNIEGLKAERAAVLPGGLCILYALFRSLGIVRMEAARSALREGVIHDLLGRTTHEDIRDETVRRMAVRYGADQPHAQRVERTVMQLADDILPAWGMNREDERRLIRWAARLHEIGKAISYTGYHRHGAYLLANSDMPGFSREQKLALAAMVLGQRRRLVEGRIRALVGQRFHEVVRLTVILRLASRLHRTRSPTPRPPIGVHVTDDEIKLNFSTGWLDDRRLTMADLVDEANLPGAAGFKLTWD